MRKRPPLMLVIGMLAAAGLGGLTLPADSAPRLLSRGFPISDKSDKARAATLRFWEAFTGNDYDQAEAVIADLTVARKDDPKDAAVTRLLGAAHGWKIMERGRGGHTAKDLVQNGILSYDYLQKAAALDPHHRVLPALLESAKAVKAVMDNDGPLLDESFEGLRQSTRRDPSLHGFVQGWVFTSLLSECDGRYAEGVEAIYSSLDCCAGLLVPRCCPRTGPLMFCWVAHRARRDSACYNTCVAPHNLQGTYLGLGDALLKQGCFKQARIIYENIRRSPNYDAWPYQDVVEHRLANLGALMIKFRSETAQLDVAEPAMSFQSRHACSACHAR